MDGVPAGGRVVQARCIALLAVLAASVTRVIPRERIITLLWPARDAAGARKLLSDTLWIIRNEIPGAVVAAGDGLYIDGRVLECDTLDFANAVAARYWPRVVELYSGPLLDGTALCRTIEFEHWLDAARERLDEQYRAALSALADEAAAEGRHRTAVDHLLALHRSDPFDCGAVHRLMHAYLAAGNRAAALRVAEQHFARLREEFGVEPDPAVIALADSLRPLAIHGAATPPWG